MKRVSFLVFVSVSGYSFNWEDIKDIFIPFIEMLDTKFETSYKFYNYKEEDTRPSYENIIEDEISIKQIRAIEIYLLKKKK